MEVNFKELKRKDLQRLCKKHGLRANATNSQMADSLVSYFKIYEKNEQVKVRSKGLGGSRSNKVERVEGDAEKVIIVIDDDEDENGSVLRSANRKSSPKSRCSSEKDEQIEARLDDSSECGDSKGTSMKWHEENAIILLDEEDDEPCDAIKSADRKKSRRSIGRVGKACEANRSNEENQAAVVLRNPKEGLLVPVRTTRSRSTNSAVAQSPVVEKAKARKERLIAGQNAELPLGTNEGEDNEIGKMKETPSLMMAVGDARVKRKRNSSNFSMKVDDEIMAFLPIEVSVTENFVGDVVYKKHVNTGMGSDITLSIDGEKARQSEEHELSTSSNLLEVVAGSVQTKRGKKRARAGLEEDSPVMEREFDKLGSAHHSELSHRDEMLEPEACFALSQTFGSPSSFNLASSRPCSLLSELQGGEDGGQFPVNNEQLSKQPGSLDRNGDLEMKESLVCKNSILASITMVVVDDGFVGRLSTSKLDHVSKDGESSRKSADTALSYSHGRHDIKEYFCSSSESHVRNLEDSYNKCFNGEAHHNRCCAGTPVLMNNLSSSSEQNCETLKFAEVTGVDATHECQDFEEVRGSEGKKRNKLSKDHEAHKEKENGENNSERITRHCDFEKASPVIIRDESMIEDIRDISDTASERTDEMTNSALLSVNIDGHNYHNLLYLAESNLERVEESQIVAQKQVRDFKTLFGGCRASSEDNSSNELEYLAETLEKPGLGLLSCKFQEQAADYEQAAITQTSKIETDSSDMRNKLELQEPIISRNLEATRNTLTEEKIDSCQVFEVEQESKALQSSGKDIIDPQDLIVSHITDVSTIVCDHLACSEFDVKDAEGIKERDSSENCSASPNRKMLSDCKALLDAEEMEDVKFLKTKLSHGEPIETEDDKVKENGSNLSPNGSGEKKITTNFKEFGSFEKFPDRPRLAESNSGQFFAPFESVIFREEHQIKGGGPFKLEGNVQITQDKLMHDGEKLWGSEKSQATGFDEDLKGKNFAVIPLAKVEEIAPFGLSKRVDNLMEKLFCLKKVLRGEIAPLIADSSLPREEEISCEDFHPSRKKEMTSEEPFSAREQESLNAFTYTDPMHEDCEQDSSNSEVNITNKFDQVATTNSPLALKENPELWKGMESCEGNDTEEASPYECNFYIRPSEEGTCPDGDVDVKEFLESVQGVTAQPGQVMADNNYVSPGKLSTFEVEAESSIASCISKSKVNNSITNSPAIYVNPFGTKCLAETSVVHSSLPNKQAKHTVDTLRMESHDKVAKTTLSDALEGNLELWKCLEKCEANNTNAASSYESDCSYNGHAEAKPGQGGDISVRDFLENAQGATSKLSEALEKIDVVSPRKGSRIDFVSERNSSASCSPVKFKLHNSITNSPAKDTKHFRNHCLSEALDGQTSLIIKEALATHTLDVLKTESHEVAITSLPDASEENLEFSKGRESCVTNNTNASFPYECDFTYTWHVDEEPCKGDDIALREFLKIDQGATTRPGDVLAKIKFLSPSKLSRIDLEDERNLRTSCIWKKAKLNSNITNSPARNTKHFGTECLDESQDGSIHGADTLVHPIPSEVKASFNNNSIDPLEKISHKSMSFCISNGKFGKSNILNTPSAHPAGVSSVGLIMDKNNTQSTKIKHSSKSKIRNSASAGSIRRPLQTVTNRMNE